MTHREKKYDIVKSHQKAALRDKFPKSVRRFLDRTPETIRTLGSPPVPRAAQQMREQSPPTAG